MCCPSEPEARRGQLPDGLSLPPFRCCRAERVCQVSPGAPVPACYRVNRKLAALVVPSVNVRVSVRQVPPQPLSVFQT
jgi:hypothetical protein